ncbi:probable insulin-like peptide 2 [Drosophila serrata]|uniref:probable insulin-like peptide 2 n=1 Tax=Drosophila serrata TaxID=7274 RepID=UPI000A1D0EB1|nr:probable insulin-like peptide 2 [Drosophila serrata]
MCRILSLITMLAVLCLTRALDQYSYEQYTLCSDKLNDMLMMVCQQFNGITSQKRGTIASDQDSLDPIQYVEVTESHPLFRGRFHGGEGVLNSLGPIRRLTRQGIVDRCCKRPCDFSVVREYCSVPRV